MIEFIKCEMPWSFFTINYVLLHDWDLINLKTILIIN